MIAEPVSRCLLFLLVVHLDPAVSISKRIQYVEKLRSRLLVDQRLINVLACFIFLVSLLLAS